MFYNDTVGLSLSYSQHQWWMVLLNSNLGAPPVPVVSSLQSNRVSKSLQTRLQTAFLFFSFSCTHKSNGLMAIGELNQGCIVNAYQMDCLFLASRMKAFMLCIPGTVCLASCPDTHSPLFSHITLALPAIFQASKSSFPGFAFSHAAKANVSVWAGTG